MIRPKNSGHSTAAKALLNDEQVEALARESMVRDGSVFVATPQEAQSFATLHAAEIASAQINVPPPNEILSRARANGTSTSVRQLLAAVFEQHESADDFVALARAARNLSGELPDDVLEKMRLDRMASRSKK